MWIPYSPLKMGTDILDAGEWHNIFFAHFVIISVDKNDKQKNTEMISLLSLTHGCPQGESWQ